MRGWGQPQQGATEGWGRVGGVLHAWVTCSGHGLTWACSQGCAEPSPAPPPGSHPSPFPGQGRPAAGEGRPLGSGWTSGSNPRQQPFPSDRFPSHFFFSAAGSTARIDGAAFPAPLSFLSLLLISAPINQPPFSSRGQVLLLP